MATMQCPVCQQSFIYEGHYQRHVKEHRVMVADVAHIDAVEARLRVGLASQQEWKRYS